MAARPTTTRAGSVTRDQDRDQNQNTDTNHIRTRSRLALPELNVDYDRSPLKNAREALRRANARYGLNGAKEGNSNVGGDGDVDAKMAEVMARSKAGSSSNPFRKTVMENMDDAQKDTKADEAKLGTSETTVDNKEGSRTTMQRRSSNPFDIMTDAIDEHPKLPKRPRSSSFDEPGPHSPSGSEAKAGGNMTDNGCSSQSPRPRSVDVDPVGSAPAESDAANMDPPPIATSESNPKRAKLGEQVTLESFFSRPSTKPKSSASKPAQPASTSPRRVFSEVQSSRPQNDSSTSTPLEDNKATIGEQIAIHPKTPTVKELRAIKMLDLRTVTPSPKKRALQIGLGTPAAKTPLRERARSIGSALASSRPNVGEEENVCTDETKENKRAASEPLEENTTMTQPPELVQQRTRSPPLCPLLLPDTKAEARSMDVDEESTDRKDAKTETAPVAEEAALPTITVSTSTSTLVVSSVSEDAIQHSSAPEPEPPIEAPKDPMPCTPRDKVISSRLLPSDRLPSTKSHLSKLIRTSPLTPLSALAPSPRQNKSDDDYGEEERSMQENDKRMADREAAKKAMQEDGEVQDDVDTPILTTGALFPAPSAVQPSPPPSATRKASKKGKQKGKALSSTSRIASGTTGIKRRNSLVPTTPRMRLTRAAVLRQKAIQAQMRTPKDKGRRSSILPPKPASTATRKSDDERKSKDPEEKKKTNPEVQRSPRKTFVLTKPSSLSPRKVGSASSSTSASANSSVTLKSTPLGSGPSKPFTFSLYPPSFNDPAATEQAQRALNKLSSALDKLAMPPPSKPNSSVGPGAELKRPASEQRERIRPATSLGFTREMSVPVTATAGREMGGARATSRGGSVEPAKRFLPPPPPAFGSSLNKDRSKGKNLATAARTAPNALGTNSSNSRMPPPSNFRFGLGSGGVFGRPIPRMRASQKTSLETVQGSPVKGGAQPQEFKEDEDEIVAADGPTGQGDAGADADASTASTSSSNANGDTSMSSMEGDTPTYDATSASGKGLKRISKLNASRRASMAFSTLAQSLHASPPNGPGASNNAAEERIPTEACADKKVVNNTGSSSRPVRAAAPRSFGFGAPGLHRTQSESAAHFGLRARSVTPFSGSDSEGPAGSGTKKSGGSTGRSKMPGSLDVLDKCTVFVDVRTEEGEDAGALFVDMLRGLGAKVLSRVGQTCTHIVYKNGLQSTVTRYRLLDEPKPSVVGIGWVVECAEKRARVDESSFRVDLESVNVAGTLKRRRSFLPRQVSSSHTAGPMEAFLSGSTSGSDTATVVHPVPKACADSDVTSEDGDTSQERVLNSNIHPLERARRRSTMIPR